MCGVDHCLHAHLNASTVWCFSSVDVNRMVFGRGLDVQVCDLISDGLVGFGGRWL